VNWVFSALMSYSLAQKSATSLTSEADEDINPVPSLGVYRSIRSRAITCYIPF
jgi:hypothetical protein